MRSAASEEPVAFENGFYLAQLPNSSAAGKLPPGGPYVLVGYDAAGKEVAAQDLQEWMDRLQPR